MAVQWSGLHEELWKLILSKVSLLERMRCSIVSTKLRTAAVAATEQFAVTSVKHWPSMRLWIEHHGQHLTSLHLCGSLHDASLTLTSLPAPRLQQLRLEHVCVQLGSSSEFPGVLQVSTALSKLELHCCNILDAINLLPVLASLHGLQHLELCWLNTGGQRYALPPVVLQQLTALTALSVSTGSTASDSLQHISCLTALQSLGYCSSPVSAILSPSTTPGFSKLTALTSISLPAMCFDPAVLQSCTQLVKLQLEADDYEGTLPGIAPGAASTLLSCIARMPRLQHLSIQECELQWPHASAAYSALTASSYLTELYLFSCQLPAGIWGAVFPAGRRLPNLKWDHNQGGYSLPPSAMEAADVAALASCCPALQECSVAVKPVVSIRPLTQLTQLTRLDVQGAGTSAFACFAQLTGLDTLQIQLGAVVAPAVVLALTGLQRLTDLTIATDLIHDLPDAQLSESVCVIMSPERGVPVWLQLVQHCAKIASCQPLLLRDLTQQVAAQQKVNTQLQQRLHAQEQHMEQLQQQVAAQAKREEKLQQQLAAAASQAGEAVELRGRVQTLEGQVQQLLQALQNRV